jgi:trans-2,3-dihydro-3-hydroxyanthranilate isomerase
MLLKQEIEILRLSRIHVSATLQGERVSQVFVGGRTIPVAMGRLFLP